MFWEKAPSQLPLQGFRLLMACKHNTLHDSSAIAQRRCQHHQWPPFRRCNSSYFTPVYFTPFYFKPVIHGAGSFLIARISIDQMHLLEDSFMHDALTLTWT